MSTTFVVSGVIGGDPGDIFVLNGTNYTVGVDAFATLNEAIAAAATDGETTIILEAGTYAEDVCFRKTARNGEDVVGEQKGDITIKAAEGAEVILTGKITLGYYEKRVGSEAWNAAVNFEGITFDQANAAAHSIDIQQVSDFSMTNCTLVGDGEYGISGTNVDNGATITGCTFTNAGIQSAGSFGTNLLIDGCTFDESRLNIQSGNSVTVNDCSFSGTLTDAHNADSFYCIRSNDNAINITNTTFNIDSTVTSGDVHPDEKGWGVLVQRGAGGTKWDVADIEVNFTDAAMEQTELFFSKNVTANSANEAGRITISGLTSSTNDVTELIAKTEGIQNVTAEGVTYVTDDGQIQSKTAANQLVVSADVASMTAGEKIVIGGYTYIVGETAFATINAALTEAKKSTEKVVIEIAGGEYTENINFGTRTFVEDDVTYVGGITFKAVDGAEVNINGYFQCNAVAGDIKDVVFDGLNITNSVRNGGYFAPIMFGDNYSGKSAGGIVVNDCILNSTAVGGTSSGVAFAMTLKCDGVEVTNNTINADCGVYGGDGNLISNTEISGNTMNGNAVVPNYNYWGVVYIYNSGEGNTISGNNISGSALDYAIRIRVGNGVILTDNTITDCGEVKLSDGSVVAGNTFDGEALVFPVYSGDALVVCGGIAGEAGDAVIINGEAYIVGTDVVGSFAEALANFDGNTSKIEIVGDITEAGPAADTTVTLSNDLTISGGDVAWTSLGGWVWFKKAEDAGDVKVTFEGVNFNATNAKKAFYFGTDVVIDSDSVVELYNGKIQEGATVQVMAGGQINSYSEALNIDGKLKLTGNEDFNAAEAELADRQAFIQYSQNIYGEIELENSYFASYQRIDLKGTGTVTADNSLLVFGADKDGNWATNPVPNGYGDFNISSADAVLELTNGSVLKATGDITNNGTIRIENSTFIANSTLASDGAVTADKKQGVLTNGEDGKIVVAGADGSTLNISNLTGSVTLEDGAVVKDSTINGGSVVLDGTAEFKGTNSVGTLSLGYYNHKLVVGADSSLTANGGRTTLSYGNIIDVDGTVEDAKTADKANLTKSLDIVAGFSFAGNGSYNGQDATLNVDNAWVSFGSSSSKNSNATGNFVWNFNNSIVDFTADFQTAASTVDGLDPHFYLNITDSVFNVNKRFAFSHANSVAVVDNSVVNITQQFKNVGEFTLQNNSQMTVGSNADGPSYEKTGNFGTLTVTGEGTSFDMTGCTPAQYPFYNEGTVNVADSAEFNADVVKNLGDIIVEGGSFIANTINNTGTVEITGATLTAGSLVNDGTVKITGESEITGTITNNDEVVIYGETSTELTVRGNAVLVDDGAVITDTTINGAVDLNTGESTWSGENTVTGIFSAGYYNYGGDLTANITGTFNNTNLLSWGNDGQTVVNIGSNDADRTTFNGGQIGEFENSTINIVNTDVNYTYAFIRGNFNLTDSVMTIYGDGVNTYFAGQAVAVIDNSTWTIGSNATIGSYGGSYMAGNADVTLQNKSVMNVGNLEIYEGEGYDVKLAVKDSAVNATGTFEIKAGAEVILNEGALLNAAKVSNNGVFNADGAAITVGRFEQNGTTGAILNNVDLNAGYFYNGAQGGAYAVVGGISKLQISDASGYFSLRLADGATLKGGTFVNNITMRAQGDVTFGETADDIVHLDSFDTKDSYEFDIANSQTVTVNGTLDIAAEGKGYSAYWMGIYGSKNAEDATVATTLTGAGTINSNTATIFQYGKIVLDEGLTVNVTDMYAADLRFTLTDMTIKGKINTIGSNNKLNAVQTSNVTVTGENAALNIDSYLLIGYETYKGNNDTVNTYKSTVNVEDGAVMSVGGITYINLESQVNVTNASYTAADIVTYGSINLAGANFTADSVSGTRLTGDTAHFTINAATDENGDAIATTLDIGTVNGMVIDVNRGEDVKDEVILTGSIGTSGDTNLRTWNDVTLSGFTMNGNDNGVLHDNTGKLFANGDLYIKDNSEININWFQHQGSGAIEAGSVLNTVNFNAYDTYADNQDATFTVNGTINVQSFIVTYYKTMDGNDKMIIGKDGVVNVIGREGVGRMSLQAGDVTVYGNISVNAFANGGESWIGSHDGEEDCVTYNVDLTIDGTYASEDSNNGKLIMTGDQILIINQVSSLNVVNGGTFSWAGDITNKGAITVDAFSTFTASSLTLGENATITIDAANFTGLKKIIDLSGNESLAGKVNLVNGEGMTLIYGADGDVILSNADKSTVYVNSAWAGMADGTEVDGKVVGVNAFASIEAVNADAASKNMVIAAGTYSSAEGVYNSSVTVLKGGITSVTADGEVVIDTGSLVFATDYAGQVTISGDFTTTDKVRYTGTWGIDWAESQNGHIRFVGSADTEFYIDGNLTAGENIQFLKGSKSVTISADSVLTLNSENCGQFAIYTNVVSYGKLIAENTQQSQAVVINQGGSLTLSGANASLTASTRVNTNKAINVDNGALNVLDGATVNGNGIVNVTDKGSVTVDGATLNAETFINAGEVILKGSAEFNADTIVNNNTFTLDDFNGSISGLVKADDAVATGNVKAINESILASDIDASLLSVGGYEDGDKLTIADDTTVNVSNAYTKFGGELLIAEGAELNVIGHYNGIDGIFVNYGKTTVNGVLNVTNDTSCGTSQIGNAELDNSQIIMTVSGENAEFNLNVTEGRDSAGLDIIAGAKVVVENGAEFNVGANTVVNNAGTFEVNGANLFVNGEFNGALTVSGASVIEGTFADGITVKAGAELAGTLIADLEAAGNFTLNAAGFAGALNGEGKTVTIGADATDIIIAENSTATLALNTGVYAADEFSFGNIAITGTAKDTVITVDDNAFGGNTVSGVAINVTNVEDGLISIFTDLANIKEVNGIAVKFFNGTYFYTYDVVDDNGTADDDSDDTVETITNILTNTKDGIKVSKNEAGNDDEEGSVEINTLVVRGDSTDTADLAVDMGGGTTQLTVVNGNANDKVQFYIGEIGKSELGGTTHVVTGNYTEVIVKNDVDAAGNIVVGAYSDFTVGGTIQGQNLNQQITIGYNADVETGDINFKGGYDSISVGSISTVNVGNVSGVSALNVNSGNTNTRTEMTVNGDYTAADTNNTINVHNYADLTITGDLTNGGIDSGTFSNMNVAYKSGLTVNGNVDGIRTFNAANESIIAVVGSVDGTFYNDVYNIGYKASFSADELNLAGGNNSLNISQEATFTLNGDLAYAQNITIGHRATATVGGDIKGVQRLVLVNGAQLRDGVGYTLLTAGDLTGTAGNDLINLGAYSKAELGTVDLGAGYDSIIVNSGAILEVDDILNNSVETINAANGSIIVFKNDEADIRLDGVNGSWQNAELVDLNDLENGANNGMVYGNEWDVYTFTADNDGAMLKLNISDLAEGDKAIVECFIDNEWVVYNERYSLNLDADAATMVRVSIDGDYADRYDKKSYTLNATIA